MPPLTQGVDHAAEPGRVIDPESTTTEPTPEVDSPFTCEYCKRAPASALLVFDMVINGHTQRIKNLVCVACGGMSGNDVRWSSLVKTSYLMPIGGARRVK